MLIINLLLNRCIKSNEEEVALTISCRNVSPSIQHGDFLTLQIPEVI